MNLFLQLAADVEVFATNLKPSINNHFTYKEIINETERLKTELKVRYFQAGSKPEFRKFTEYHLEKLSELLGTVRDIASGVAAKSGETHTIISSEKMADVLVVYHKLRALMAFFYEIFGKYLPKNHHIPVVSQPVFIKEVMGYKEEITRKLTQSDPLLAQWPLKPFDNFVQLKELRTWHQVDYCRSLHLAFGELQAEGTALNTEKILRFLVKMNYNSPEFYRFCIDLIKKEEVYPNIKRLEHLKKEVGQIQVNKGMQYRSDMKSIKKQIQCWINEEIQYWKESELIKEMEEEIKAASTDKPGVSGGKINTRFTEHVLAFKTSVEIEAGLLFGKGHPQGVLKKTLETYNCINRDHISYESFRKRYYERNVETAKEYRRHLRKCLNITNFFVSNNSDTED
ncbi:hypothetical protein [Desertivirga brevis]|uniref:hypothetical protein n=1 Tax=Desertivirga brevis TaxID=2810310 RepID=UPI001A967EA7|nr:hypothetical protein [Pedobacter sp. SYSU D00873]